MRQQATKRERGELNIRGMDPNLVEQVKIAALRRGGRAALRTWVTQALARALRQEAEPRRTPRIKLCANCVTENLKRASSFQTSFQPGSPSSVGAVAEVDRGAAPAGSTQTSAPPAIAKLLARVRAHEVSTNEPGANPIAGERTPADTPAPLPGAAESPHQAANETAADPQPSSLPKHRAVEVAPLVWVGTDEDYAGIQAAERLITGRQAAEGGESLRFEPWCTLSAAKEPWHRKMVGYETKSAPEGPERLVAVRKGIPGFSGDHMALNLIDVRELGPGGTHYVPDVVIDAALEFLDSQIARNQRVLVHAGDGKSRAPAIALLWMARRGLLSPVLDVAIEEFKLKYPRFMPGAGIWRYLELRFADVATVPPTAGDAAQPNVMATEGGL